MINKEIIVAANVIVKSTIYVFRRRDWILLRWYHSSLPSEPTTFKATRYTFRFSAIFHKGCNFSDFLIAFLHFKSLLKKRTTKTRNFRIEMTSFQKGRKTLRRPLFRRGEKLLRPKYVPLKYIQSLFINGQSLLIYKIITHLLQSLHIDNSQYTFTTLVVAASV